MVRQQQSISYYRAARFSGEQTAGKAYFQLQELIYGPECDISAYRFEIKGVFHVAVFGQLPGQVMDRQLQGALGLGEPVSLNERTLNFLTSRRQQQGTSPINLPCWWPASRRYTMGGTQTEADVIPTRKRVTRHVTPGHECDWTEEQVDLYGTGS